MFSQDKPLYFSTFPPCHSHTCKTISLKAQYLMFFCPDSLPPHPTSQLHHPARLSSDVTYSNNPSQTPTQDGEFMYCTGLLHSFSGLHLVITLFSLISLDNCLLCQTGYFCVLLILIFLTLCPGAAPGAQQVHNRYC